MSLLNKVIYHLRKKANYIMAVAFIAGISMLYFSAQNDIYSPLLFLYKAAFFPLSLVFLVTVWLLAFLVTKTFKINTYRKWPMCVALLVTLLFVPHLLPNWQQSVQFSEAANQQGFSVATFSAMTRSRNAKDIINFVQKYQPQVLCLQEINADDMPRILNLYPYQSRHGKSGLVILSQFPLSHFSEEYSLNEQDDKPAINSSIKNAVQSIELVLPNQSKARVLNVHMPRQYRQGGNLTKTIESIRWHTDTEMPIVLCGDFNLTPQHTIYSHLTNQLGLSDAQLSQTWEYGFTFPNGNRNLARFGTWLRIDYLFSRGFFHGNTKVINVSNLSDHRAVLSKFLLVK